MNSLSNHSCFNGCKIEVPASITCFFTPSIGKDAKSTGSYGLGIALKAGAEVYIDNIDNKYNNRYTNKEENTQNEIKTNIPTVKYALKKLKSIYNIKNKKKIYKIKPNFPIGCGFGMSSSMTFSELISECIVNKINIPLYKLADIVHEAEVFNGTGLGDVVCQMHGGIVCRLRAASPSIMYVKKFFWNIEFDILILGGIKTKEALKEYSFSSGKHRLREFLRKPTLDNLFYQSKKFAYETGIAEMAEVKDIIEAVECNGGKASMIMLGKAVFAINGFSTLKEFGQPLKAKVDLSGLNNLKI